MKLLQKTRRLYQSLFKHFVRNKPHTMIDAESFIVTTPGCVVKNKKIIEHVDSDGHVFKELVGAEIENRYGFVFIECEYGLRISNNKL